MISKLIKINNTNILRKAYQAASTLATSDMSRVSEICDLSQKHAMDAVSIKISKSTRQRYQYAYSLIAGFLTGHCAKIHTQ